MSFFGDIWSPLYLEEPVLRRTQMNEFPEPRYRRERRGIWQRWSERQQRRWEEEMRKEEEMRRREEEMKEKKRKEEILVCHFSFAYR